MKWVKPSFYRRGRCSERHRLYKASADTSEGLAYRYVLAELNPFALTGDASIYVGHNAARELKLYNPDTGAGGNDMIEGEEARRSIWKEAV